MSYPKGNKRGVLNRVQQSVVCNASATNFLPTTDFSGIFGYPNVNQIDCEDCERILIPEVSASGFFQTNLKSFHTYAGRFGKR